MNIRRAYNSILTVALLVSLSAATFANGTYVARIGSAKALAVQSMNISLDNHGVKIAWNVRDAKGISAFEIQRAVVRNGNSSDVSWSTIKAFPVIDGRIIESSFEYYDLTAPVGSPVILYRIKQVSDVNDVLYSSPVKIHLVGSSNLKIASAYPNPVQVNSASTIQYSVGSAQPVTVAAFDVTGKQLAVLASGFHSMGEYSVDFSTANLNPGTYFIRLVTSSSSSVQRLVVGR